MTRPNRLRGVYVLSDAAACARQGLSVVEVGRALLLSEPPPSVLQIRAKEVSDQLVLKWTLELLGAARERGVLVFINDRADLAELSGADGVHVGQGDLPVSEVRRLFPRLLVGVSTHNELQFEAALVARPDYVALGPVYATGSKENPEPTVGIELLACLSKRARMEGVPLVAIGGVNEANLQELKPFADMVAVISAVLPPGPTNDAQAEITRAASRLGSAWVG